MKTTQKEDKAMTKKQLQVEVEYILFTNEWRDNHQEWQVNEFMKLLDTYADAVREETIRDVLKIGVDWAFRKYPPRRVLREMSKYMNDEIKALQSQKKGQTELEA